MLASIQRAVLPSANVDSFRLDPAFHYIRTTHGRHVGFAWLGHTERSPQGPVEVYYSSSGEVLRINGGRIAGAAGFKTEWRRVEGRRPSWASMAASPGPTRITRVRDVMPGYRFGVEDVLLVHRIEPPEKSALRGRSAESLTWFEERMISSAGASLRRSLLVDSDDTWLPPARYAVDLSGGTEQVVYSEQCLAPDLCIAWERWTAAMQKPLKSAASSAK